ncbi:MAG: hypothetical protein WA125_01240 [Desulfosporosinus sp.]
MVENFIQDLVKNLLNRHNDKKLRAETIHNSIKNSLSMETLINNLTEVLRLSKDEIEKDLKDFGFKDLIDQFKLGKAIGIGNDESNKSDFLISNNASKLNPFPALFKVRSTPNFLEPILLGDGHKEILNSLFESVSGSFHNDPFIPMYRENVISYYRDFNNNIAPVLAETIKRYFGPTYPKYMVTTGIGANEQFTHFVASCNNSTANSRLKWLIVDSPKSLSLLPNDANINNTLFVEFSRSSLTEETVKIHEYTPREAKRIVFSNTGPLKQIAERDQNLILELPDEVSGRFGRNKTPILLAPMYIAGLDVESYWKHIDSAINAFDLTDPQSLPFVLAKYILLHQTLSLKNLIYLGCNDNDLGLLADEFIQFWNEGVNKGGNDLLISRFFGLPRDSHMNVEGLLGNRLTKMAIFFLRTNMRSNTTHPLVSSIIDPINPEHIGLHFGDEEVVLAYANYKRFSELMPSILIEIPLKPSLEHSAILGQLFADTTFIYSRLKGIDPGSNPEVKSVRERSANLLAGIAHKIREDKNKPINEAIVD